MVALMPYSPVSVANGVLELGFRDGIPVDPMKVQKLLYFMHGYYLASTDQPLFDELFQAWKLGPVLPSIYHWLKRYGGNPVREYGTLYQPNAGRHVPAVQPSFDNNYIAVRDYVWKQYGQWESMALSSFTHLQGQAWDRTLKAVVGILGPQIQNEEIKNDFRPLIIS